MNTLLTLPLHWSCSLVSRVQESENLDSQAALFAPAGWKLEQGFAITFPFIIHKRSRGNTEEEPGQTMSSLYRNLANFTTPAQRCVYIGLINYILLSFLPPSLSYVVPCFILLPFLWVVPCSLLSYFLPSFLPFISESFLGKTNVRNDTISRKTVLCSSAVWAEDLALRQFYMENMLMLYFWVVTPGRPVEIVLRAHTALQSLRPNIDKAINCSDPEFSTFYDKNLG
jgi:hypothetical protein